MGKKNFTFKYSIQDIPINAYLAKKEIKEVKEKLKDIVNKKGKRALLFLLGLLESQEFGQVSYLPLGKIVKNKITDALGSFAREENWYEIEFPLIFDSQMLKKYGRYKDFENYIYHIKESPNFVIFPTSEELFVEAINKKRLKPDTKCLGIWEIKQHFRKVKRGRKPLRLSMFNMFYVNLYFKNSEDKYEMREKIENFFDKIWNATNLKDNIKKCEEENPLYVDYFIIDKDGDDFYKKENSRYRLYKNHEDAIRGISVGMYFEPEINENLIAGGIGIERLLYSEYVNRINFNDLENKYCSSIAPFDTVIIPIVNPKKIEKEINKTLSAMSNKNIGLDNRKLPIKSKEWYNSLLGVENIIKVGKYEVEILNYDERKKEYVKREDYSICDL